MLESDEIGSAKDCKIKTRKAPLMFAVVHPSFSCFFHGNAAHLF